jgi:peptidoglycan hydrolase-like protein with peptidoglycan-binding domain
MEMGARLAVFVALAAFPVATTAQSAQDILNLLARTPGAVPQVPGMVPGAVPGTVPGMAAPSGDVAQLQRLLNGAGFPAGRPDGVMGPSTMRAILAFQSRYGYPPTGIPGPREIEALRALAAAAAPPPSAAGPDIRGVQAALSARGYDPGAVDGQWGRRSQAALDAFRRAEGIARQGPPVAEDLAALTGVQAPAPQPAALPAPLPSVAEPPPPPPIDLTTSGPDGATLTALPVVDRAAGFRVAWSGDADDRYWLAIVPPGARPQPDIAAWPFGPASPTVVQAPDAPGPYEILWIDVTDGAVRVRRALEVR